MSENRDVDVPAPNGNHLPESDAPAEIPEANVLRVGHRKRGRIASACLQCHTRKQKCNGDQPCQNCIRRGVPHSCTLPPLQTPRSERNPNRRHKRVKRVASSGLSPSPGLPPQQDDQREDGPPPAPDRPPSPFQPQLGQLWKSRGAPAFFGNSYFGPQVAATIIDSSAAADIPTGPNPSRRSMNARPFRDEAGPFSQLWDLLGLLPRQKSTVDRLVDCFLADVNWNIDAVHPTSFKQDYVRFWERKSGFDDVTTVDLRWLALLFIILAIGAYLDCPKDCSPETQREYEESSLRFYWASRRAIVIAPSFYGESTDLVRAGILVTRYLIHSQRLSESWLTIGFATRMAIAQGFHVDGNRWHIPRRATEIRRRLWCQLYTLDRMIALAIGRPYGISDAQSLIEEPENIWIDDMTNEEALSAQPLPLSDPTPSVMSALTYRLSRVIGQIQERCFGIQSASYRDVLELDEKLVAWKDALPSYFAVEDPDLVMDESRPFLKWQRLYLHTSFHFARITLHRPYLLRSSITNRYHFSRDVCLSSACADLKTRLSHQSSDSAGHYTWCLGAHQLFNSAIILGILAIREPRSTQTMAIIDDLEAYCEKQNTEMWMNEFGYAEIKVVQMCIAKLKQKSKHPSSQTLDEQMQSQARLTGHNTPLIGPHLLMRDEAMYNNTSANNLDVLSPSTLETVISTLWQDQPFPGSFPGPTDLQTWQEMINSIDTDWVYET
ncbi:fungal-specific transcription factor domain-containing protein [Xylogone sp. PMI_703]|nr:fungal-specific transcription factor domain-containing protein [Xylogone sp. PMI_703]